MEGLWETQRGDPLKLFGWPDQEEERTKYALEIPKLSSLILTHELDGEVKGLKEWPRDERPPVAWVFWSFWMVSTWVSAFCFPLPLRIPVVIA